MNAGKIIALIGLLVCMQQAAAADTEPTLEQGAGTFVTRCALCHGTEGYGDGLMPISLKDYPDSNLYKNKHGKDADSLRLAILEGGSKGKMHIEMPPWADELTYTEIESLVLFMTEMYQSPDTIKALVANVAIDDSSTAFQGRKLFENYCALCHGKEGKGDGKMARIIKDPPPFNLTQSVMPSEYLRMIIAKGGAELGRSERMPPWEGQFNDKEIDTIVKYIMTLRK